jgi:hypothetical protein
LSCRAANQFSEGPEQKIQEQQPHRFRKPTLSKERWASKRPPASSICHPISVRDRQIPTLTLIRPAWDVARSGVRVYLNGSAKLCAWHLSKRALNLNPADILIAEPTTSNEVRYRLKATARAGPFALIYNPSSRFGKTMVNLRFLSDNTTRPKLAAPLLQRSFRLPHPPFYLQRIFAASESRLHLIDSIGRGGQIRTGDPLRPRQVRYQAALRPDRCCSIHSKTLLDSPHSATRIKTT